MLLNTLAVSKRLIQAGMSQTQAEALTLAINEGLTDTMVTKEDLKQSESAIDSQIQTLETNLKAKIQATENTLRSEMKFMENSLKFSLVKWVVGLLFGQTAILVAVLALLKF